MNNLLYVSRVNMNTHTSAYCYENIKSVDMETTYNDRQVVTYLFQNFWSDFKENGQLGVALKKKKITYGTFLILVQQNQKHPPSLLASFADFACDTSHCPD